MQNNLKISLLKICSLFEKHNVNYIVVGGTAVALHGYYRHSTNIFGELADKPDIDIWYNPTYENYFNLLKVLNELGHDITKFENEQSPNPRKSFFKLDFVDITFDILPEIKAPIKFSDADKRKMTIDVDRTQIHVIAYLDLIEDKKATARKKDLDDIEQLKINRKED